MCVFVCSALCVYVYIHTLFEHSNNESGFARVCLASLYTAICATVASSRALRTAYLIKRKVENPYLAGYMCTLLRALCGADKNAVMFIYQIRICITEFDAAVVCSREYILSLSSIYLAKV